MASLPSLPGGSATLSQKPFVSVPATVGGIDHFDGQVWNPVDVGGQLSVSRVTGVGDSVMFVDLRGYFHQLVRLAPWPAH